MSRTEPLLNHPASGGCLIALAVMVPLSLLVSLVFTTWLRLISVETEREIITAVWLVSICLGGYVAARRGGDWRTSLIVGCIAELFLANEVLQRAKPDTGYLATLYDWLENPFRDRSLLLKLVMTIPAAVLGGFLFWLRRNGPPEAVSRSD